MIFRKLGRTDINVGVIGIGTEHIVKEEQNTVTDVVHRAVDSGVNYFDLLWPQSEYRDKLGHALKGLRSKAILQAQFCAVLENGQLAKTRELKVCMHFYEDLLNRIDTDYMDVLMIHNVDGLDEYEEVMKPGGIMDTALKLRKEGKARYIGMGGHTVSTAMEAVNSGLINVQMFPVNPAFDTLPGETQLGTLLEDAARFSESECGYIKAISDRKALYSTCENRGVGLVAMKPFGAGRLLDPANYKNEPMTPVQCISYVLSQPGVDTLIAGVKNIDELEVDLTYLNATDKEKDFSRKVSETNWKIKGSCMYCNHCLPCPAEIDIAAVTRLLDSSALGITEKLAHEYNSLSSKASSCIQCMNCNERCPFDVDAAANIKKAELIFEK